MEPNSQDNLRVLEGQIRDIYEKVFWSHKIQEKCADIVHYRHDAIKIIIIILSALTTGGIIVAIFTIYKFEAGIASAIASGLQFGLNAYNKDYNLGEIAQKHALAASDLWNVREDLLSLLVAIKTNNISIEEVIKKRDDIQEILYNIYKTAQRTNSKAYKMASKSIKYKGERSSPDEEIDIILPQELRRNQS